MKGTTKYDGTNLIPFRETQHVDRILGRSRQQHSSPSQNIDWSNCPLMKAYPDWDVWHDNLKAKRGDTK